MDLPITGTGRTASRKTTSIKIPSLRGKSSKFFGVKSTGRSPDVTLKNMPAKLPDPAGTNRVMTLIGAPVKVRRALCLKRFVSADEFELTLMFKLERLQPRRGNILMLAVAEHMDAYLPRFNVLPPVFQIQVFGAINLARLNRKAAVYVTCNRQGSNVPFFKSSFYRGQEEDDPVWDSPKPVVVPDLHSDEAIEFKVWEFVQETSTNKEIHELLATALFAEGFAEGFDGDIPLIMRNEEILADDAIQGGKSGLSGKSGDTTTTFLSRMFRRSALMVKISHARGCCLSVDISQGDKKNYKRLDPIDVPLGETIKVKFLLEKEQDFNERGYRISIMRLSEETEADCRCEVQVPTLHLPRPLRLFLYASGPEERPANVRVIQLQYKWKSREGLYFQNPEDELVSFKLPEEERAILRDLAKEFNLVKHWEKFDIFFGLILLVNSVLIGAELELAARNPGAVPSSTWRQVEGAFLVVFIIEFLLRLSYAGYRYFSPPPVKSGDEAVESWALEEGPDEQEEFNLVEVFDRWLLFDAIVIFFGIVSLVLDALESNLPFPVSVLRILRLLKLIKMIRLVRAFKDLGLLVSALFRCIPFIFWTCVCLGFVLFIGAMITAEFAKALIEHDVQLNGKILANFDSVSTSSWYLTVMSTYDCWGIKMREIIEIDTWQSQTMFLIIAVPTTIISIGIFNMIVGLMCLTAVTVEQSENRRRSAVMLEAKQFCLSKIRHILRNYGPRPIFRSSRNISTPEFYEIISVLSPVHKENEGSSLSRDRQRQLKELFEVLEVSHIDLMALATAFEESGEIEIDGLIEGMAVLELQRFYTYRDLSVEGELFGADSVGVRPLDMLFLKTSLGEMEKNVNETERCVLGQASLTSDILRCLNNICFEAHTLFSFDMPRLDISTAREKALFDSQVLEPSRPIHIGALVNHILEYRASLAAQGLEFWIDIVFSFLIVLNAVILGFQITTQDTIDDSNFYYLDALFTLLFTIELVIRLVLAANMKDTMVFKRDDGDREDKNEKDPFAFGEEDDDQLYSITAVEELRSKMICRIIPPCPRRGVKEVLHTAPSFFLEAFAMFDLVIVLFSIVDAVFLVVLRAAAGFGKMHLLSLLRVLRLVRLLKLVRIVRMFPDLQKIIWTLMGTSKLVLRQILVMLILAYMFSLLMVFAVNKETASPLMNYYFDGVLCGSITAFQLMVFDEWDIIMRVTSEEYPELLILAEIPLMIVGVMFMNSVVGMFCTAAVDLVRQKAATKRHKAYLTVLQAMGNLADFLHHELHTQMVTQEMFENALNVKFRPKRTDLHGKHLTANKIGNENLAEVNSRALQPENIEKLRSVLRMADMVPLVWRQIFEKVDYERRGYLSIDLLALGAILLRVDLEQLDVFAASTALRQVREKATELQRREGKCHRDMDVLLRMCNNLCHRRDDHEYKVKHSEDLLYLSTKGDAAVKGLRAVRDEGTHDQAAYRNVRMSQEMGRGFVRKADDNLLPRSVESAASGKSAFQSSDEIFILEGTNNVHDVDNVEFRKHLDTGDVILVEMEAAKRKDKQMEGSNSKTSSKAYSAQIDVEERTPSEKAAYAPVRVLQIINNDFLKVQLTDVRTWTKERSSWSRYQILRADVLSDGKMKADLQTHVKPAPFSYQPDSAADMFEWEVSSMKKSEKILESLQMDVQYGMKHVLGRTAKDFSDTQANLTMGKRYIDLLTKERETLVKEYLALEQCFKPLIERSYLHKGFKGWQQLKSRPKWTKGFSFSELTSKRGQGAELTSKRGQRGRSSSSDDREKATIPPEQSARSPRAQRIIESASRRLQSTGQTQTDFPTEVRSRATGKSKPTPPSRNSGTPVTREKPSKPDDEANSAPREDLPAPAPREEPPAPLPWNTTGEANSAPREDEKPPPLPPTHTMDQDEYDALTPAARQGEASAAYEPSDNPDMEQKPPPSESQAEPKKIKPWWEF